MEKKFSFKQVLAIAAFCVAATVAITTITFQFVVTPETANVIPGESTAEQQQDLNDKLNEIKTLVDKYYVGEIDSETMAHNICAGYIAGLNDKYSAYVTPEYASESLNSLYGVNTGMGIQISMHPDKNTMVVLEVHDGSPAMKAGIERGDEVISVDGKQVAEFGYAETLNYIKTIPLETTIKVKVIRNGEEKEFDVTLTQYINQSVFYRMIGNKGYILITGFNDRSPEQFEMAVDTLTEEGATALVIDLRGNGGGTLNAAYKMLDYCIPEGLAIKVKYKNDNMNEVYMSDANEVNLPIVCLTDENTASASELFTQGLKDYNKAVSVGRLTYGKGVVQRTFTLSDGSLVRFTIGEYYTNNGVCLDGIGVKPDIEVSFTEEELKYRIINGIENDKDFIAAVEYLDNQPS